MKKIFKLPLVLVSIGLFLTGCDNNNTSSTDSIDNNTNTSTTDSTIIEEKSIFDPGDYYDSISDSLTGNALMSALTNLNNTKRKTIIGYDKLRYFYQRCDVDWVDKTNRKIVGFYDNSLVGPGWDSAKTWNREHVWPKSRGGDKVDGDAHMTRPASVNANSSRANAAYASSGAYDPGCEGVANYRGIAARIIFYCAIADTSLKIVDSTNLSGKTMGKLSDLLKWNLEYLPSTSETAALELRVEQNRNYVIQTHENGQGNRNPFIDHPEYACKIWGSTNSNTKKICGM